MKPWVVLWTILFTCVGAMSAAAKTGGSKDKALLTSTTAQLPWEYDLKNYALEQSGGTLRLVPGFALLRGGSAQQFLSNIQGMNLKQAEALLLNPETGSQWVFNHYGSGYIPQESWDKLEPALLLEAMAEAAEAENEERRKLNLAELVVSGWLEEPSWDASTQSVSWAIDLMQKKERVVNAVVLKLGRDGFEKMTWVGTYREFKIRKGMMHKMVQSFAFPQGKRYEEFQVGDKMAGLNLVQLVALTTGGQVAARSGMAGLGASFLVFGKTLIIVPILLVLGVVVLFIKKMMAGQSHRTQQASSSH